MRDPTDDGPDRTNSTPRGATVDDLFGLLADRRRRAVLSELAKRRTSVSPRALARAVAARERETDATTPPASTIDAVHATLHHTHLPKLDAAGLVRYEREDRTVALRADLECRFQDAV